MPQEQGFFQQALGRCVPQITQKTNHTKNKDTPNTPHKTPPTKDLNEQIPSDTDDSQHNFTIALLRTILKRPSAHTNHTNKKVTFDPNIVYHNEITENQLQPPAEEDGISNLHQNNNINAQNNKDTQNDTKQNPNKIENPTSYKEKDLENIPDTVDAPNNINSNLNDAQLVYLNALFGDEITPQSRQTSLIDTGASFSFMHLDIFKNIPNYKNYIKTTKPLKIRTGCDQLLTDTAYVAIIPITFKDNTDNLHTINALFLVVNVISKEVFLGNDILMRSGIFSNINKNTMTYNNPKTHKHFEIPIMWQRTSPNIKLLAKHAFEIAPNSSLKVFTKPNVKPPNKTMIVTNDTFFTNEEPKTLQVVNMRLTPSPKKPIPIILTNNSDNYMRFEKKDELASLIDTNKNDIFTEIYNVTANPLLSQKHDDEILTINRSRNNAEKKHTPQKTYDDIPQPIQDYKLGKTREELDKIDYMRRKLKQESTMNDQERKEALDTFINTGKYEETVTKVIEKNDKLSELKKDNKKWLTPQQCIDTLNLTHFTKDTQSKIKDMFLKYESVLAKSDFDIPRAKGILADPVIRQDYVNKCMAVKQKNINLNIRNEVQEILNNMCDAGVIEETDEPTPFLSNLLVCKKKNGKLRLLYDCRPSNMAIINTPSTFTPKTDLTYILGNAGRVSSIDLSNSYFQIGIHPSKRSLFSFCDSRGIRYRYCVLAQGFHSSPFYLTTLLNKCLKGLENNVIYYADDIFIYTKKDQTLDDHLNVIEEVLKRLQSFNLKVKCSKIEIDPPCINILGVTRDRDGKFRIPDDKASILANWPDPKTTDDIKSYLGMANYFNDHIYNFWNIILPLQEQSKSKTNSNQVILTDETKKAIEKLKKAITNHIAISAPNLDKEFFISSDSSGYASAALLYQVYDDVVHYLGAASRLYTKQERKYSTIKLEIMALLYAFSKWDYILRYSRHTINALTDARGILYIKNGKDTSNMLFKISQIISHYDMRIMHTSGNPKPANKSLQHNKNTSNWLPDIMSRCQKPKTTQNHKSISEKELNELLELLTIKEGHTITPQQLQKFMRAPGLPSPSRGLQTKRISKVKVNTENIQPTTKVHKKIHPPQLVSKHKYYPNQLKDNENNQTDYSTPNATPNKTSEKVTTNLNVINSILELQNNQTFDEYTYYRYSEEDIPCHALNIIRYLMDYPAQRNIIPTPQETQTYCQEEQPTTTEQDIIEEANKITTEDVTEQIIINSKLIQDGKIALDVLLDAQRTDPYVIAVKARDPLPNKYSIKNGYLLHQTNGKDKFVIPQSLFTIVQNSLHHQIWGRHQPAEKMYHILTKHFYLPGLMTKLKRIVSSCLVCNSTKLKNIKRQTFGKKKLPLANREMWMADLGGGYEDGPSKYFIIFVDALTLFSVAVPIPNKNTETLLQAFTNNIVNIFGPPKFFYSDNEPAFDSSEFKEYCLERDIEILHAAPYASFSNGNCETQIKLAKDIVRAYTRSSGLSYKKVLPHITRSLNNRPLTSSPDYTPAKLMFGSDIQPQLLSTSQNYSDPTEYLKDFTNYMKEITETHRERRNKNAERQREYHNKSKKEITFQEGQHVYYKNFKIPENQGALANKWNGPAEIITLHDNGRTATIKDYDQNTRIVHTQFLKHYDTDGTPTIAPTHLDERAIQMLKKNTHQKPNDIGHLPLTRSHTQNHPHENNETDPTENYTTNQTNTPNHTPPITDTPPDSMEINPQSQSQLQETQILDTENTPSPNLITQTDQANRASPDNHQIHSPIPVEHNTPEQDDIITSHQTTMNKNQTDSNNPADQNYDTELTLSDTNTEDITATPNNTKDEQNTNTPTQSPHPRAHTYRTRSKSASSNLGSHRTPHIIPILKRTQKEEPK